MTRLRILAVISVILFFRVIFLDKSFQGDEYFSLSEASSRLRDIPFVLTGDTHPPLYFCLLHFWAKISSAEWFLRLLSVIPSLGIVIAVYFMGRKRNFVAALLVTLSPVMVWSAQYIRVYSLATLFSVLSVYYLLDVLEDKSWGKYILFSVLSLYTFYFSVLVIAAESLFIILYKRDILRKWAISQLVIVILYIPQLPFLIQPSYLNHPQMSEKRGFYIGNIHVGGMLRGASGLIGFDPLLMKRGVCKRNCS